MEIAHETVVVERVAATTAEGVFAALADQHSRPQWAVPLGDGLRIDELDLRTGGIDRFECGPPDSLGFHVTVEHLVVEPSTLIVDREQVTGSDGALLATSLVTWELTPDPAGVRIRETVQMVSMVGPGMIEGTRGGTAVVLDQLVAHLEG